MKHASIGSVSHGTLRSEDLLEAFSDELAYHIGRNKPELTDEQLTGWSTLIEQARTLLQDERNGADDDSGMDWEDEATTLVDELQDELTAFAPPYCYFGTNEGDGADFGFWPSMDEINELPRVKDPNEVEGMGEDCVFVNDHGNVTVYGADGSILIDLV